MRAAYRWNAEDGAWEVELIEEPRVHTWGRSFVQAREHVVEAAALWFNVEPDEVEVVDDDVKVPEEAEGAYGEALLARAALERASSQWAASLHEAARALVSRGLTYRDAGDLLGVSHQRIGQVVNAAANASSPTTIVFGTTGTGKTGVVAAFAATEEGGSSGGARKRAGTTASGRQPKARSASGGRFVTTKKATKASASKAARSKATKAAARKATGGTGKARATKAARRK